VIRSFADKETAALFADERVRKLPPAIRQAARRKLAMLDRAVSLEDLRSPPGNRLERLSGDRDGQWSVCVNDQWRICFEWRDGDAYNVAVVDYR
jgi:toxin HigB-1